MTSDSTPEIYPQYCFHLSPTINKWCHFRASDIARLTAHPGFGGQDLFFHLNHPIKWVRIAGVVVAIDEYAGRRFYTVDDGTGINIECVTPAPKTAPDAKQPSDSVDVTAAGNATLPVSTSVNSLSVQAGLATTTAVSASATQSEATTNLPRQKVPDDIDVGLVVDVKGVLSAWRGMMQIKVEKMVIIRSTQQEVEFWKKTTELRETVLNIAWVLDRREVRRCRKEAEGRSRDKESHKHHGRRKEEQREQKQKQKKKSTETMEREHRVDTAVHHRDRVRKPSQDQQPSSRMVTDSEKKRKVARPAVMQGKYSALGL